MDGIKPSCNGPWQFYGFEARQPGYLSGSCTGYCDALTRNSLSPWRWTQTHSLQNIESIMLDRASTPYITWYHAKQHAGPSGAIVVSQAQISRAWSSRHQTRKNGSTVSAVTHYALCLQAQRAVSESTSGLRGLWSVSDTKYRVYWPNCSAPWECLSEGFSWPAMLASA